MLIALALAVAVPALAQVPAASPLTRIGAAAAVAGRVLAVAPNASVGRVVGSGKPIFLNDHVTTGANGRLQVLLLDQTVFTLGPDSDMVLDEFVYDPKTDQGRLAATVEKGAFRFISGHLSHPTGANMKVRTPSGTMGIRGTIVLGQVSEQSTTLILAGPGAENNAGETPGMIDVSNGAGSVTIDHPGYGTTLSGNLPPTPPAPMTQQLLQLSEEVGLPPTDSATGGARQANTGSSNATTASGQDTASSASDASIASDLQATDNGANNTTTFANQDSGNTIQDGPSVWEQLPLVTLGSDKYTGTGTLSCPNCTQAQTGDLSFILEISFANRTLGGGTSEIRLNPSGSMDLDNTTTNINSIPFGNSGTAQVTLQASDLTDSNFSGSKFTLENKGGVVAQDAALELHYNNTQTALSATGSAAGSRTDAPLPPQ